MPFRAPDQHGRSPQHRGRFPGFDVLDEVDRWDDVTAGAVLARLAPANELAFFSKDEQAIVTPLCDLLLAQDAEPRIPVVALIDTRLALGETDGWHYDDMPPDPTAWRESLQHLDADAAKVFGAPFAALTPEQQAALVQDVQDLAAAGQRWYGKPAAQIWGLWARYACAAFYSHPWAWNEIGFPGPAYPRGYKNRHVNGRERFEVRDDAARDPVPFAARVEQARREHSELVETHRGSVDESHDQPTRDDGRSSHAQSVGAASREDGRREESRR
jgi:hypothetical protein